LKVRTKRIIAVVFLLCASAGAALWYAGREQVGAAPVEHSMQQPKAPLVEVAPAQQTSIARTLELTGEVIATDAVVIAATSEGPIVHSPWREGDDVRRGETLVEIEREVYRAEVQTARAALAVTEARLADLEAGARPEEIEKAEASVARCQATCAEARKSYERQMQLIQQDFTSQQSVDQARERMDVADAELRVAQEALRMLKAGPTATELAVQEAAVKEAAAKSTSVVATPRRWFSPNSVDLLGCSMVSLDQELSLPVEPLCR